MTETSDERTLQVRVGERDQTRQEAREAIQALEQGEEADGLRVLNLANDASLARLCRETTLSTPPTSRMPTGSTSTCTPRDG